MKKTLIILAAVMMAACASTGRGSSSMENAQVWIVASRTANCTGVMPQQCLLVKADGDGQWQYHYGGIEGFTYEPGYEYVLTVRTERVENPPMDASSLRYVLGRVISKERKTSEDLPEDDHR